MPPKKRSARGQQPLQAALESLYSTVADHQDKGGRLVSELFQSLPSREEYPDYFQIISTPFALDQIREKLDAREYSTLQDMYSDMKLIMDNARTYNRKGSWVYKDASALMALFDEAFAVKVKELGNEGSAPTPSKGAPVSSPVSKGAPKKSGLGEMKKVLKKVSELVDEEDNERLVSELFLDLPDAKLYPDYYELIKTPVALNSMIKKLDKGEYTSVEDLEEDFETMVKNAKTYNEEGSSVITDALALLTYFYELVGKKPATSLIGPQGYLSAVDSITYKGETYKSGDGVLIQNLNDPSKPIIGLIYEVWTDDAETQGFTANWFLRPEQTVHKASTKFMENEVFKTNHMEHYTVKDIEGRCAILYVRDYTRGRPPGFTFENTFVVESRYNEQAKNFSKIKNWSTCLPDSLKNVEPDLQLFSAPMVPVRVASALAEALAKREAESSVDHSDVEIPEKRAYKKRAPAERKTSGIAPSPSVSASVPMMAQQVPMPAGQPISPSSLAMRPPMGNPYMGVPGYTGSPALRPQGPLQNQQAQGPRPPHRPSAINPMYYQQLGALPGDTISDKSAQNFERFPDGRMKWFSGPPLDVLDPAPLDHSLAFLKHKATFKLEEEAAKKSDAKRGSPVKESRSPKKARTTSPDAKISSGVPLPSSSPATSSPPAIVDWAPLTETLETLAGIWLKEADSLLMS